jgi:hypothetical protein
VTINVKEGDETTSFQVHKSFLIAYSDFFRAALDGNYAESRTNTVELREVSATIFDIFSGWLYNQQIVTTFGDVPQYHELIQLWLFGDMVQAPRLQNQLIFAMNSRSGRLIDDLQVSFKNVYNNTVTGKSTS